MALKKRYSKKDILCRFLRNCRNKSKCEYFHPHHDKRRRNDGTEKIRDSERDSKNVEKEMHRNVHFLTEQMKRMQKDIQQIKAAQIRGKE